MEPCQDFSQFLSYIGSHYADPHCLNGFEQGKWKAYSTQEVLREVRHLALGLEAAGLTRGACVGLMALPSPRWTIACLAVIVAGGVVVPLFPNISEENFTFEVKQTDMHWFIVDSDLHIPIFENHRAQFTHIVDLSLSNATSDSYVALCERGALLDDQQPERYDALLTALKPDDLASIVYTSGSTGLPKGVELTQYNLLGHLHAHPWELLPSSDRYLSILPLAHIFGYSCNFLQMGWGIEIYYWNDHKNLGNVCRDLHPTIISVVPRLLEKIYTKMAAKVHEAGYLKRKIGEWAFGLALNEEDSLVKHLAHPLVDRLVYTALRDALGGKLRIVVSGGAPLNPHLNHFYHEIGVPIYEGWGLTEACPITVNAYSANKIGTVGKPFKGIELKISPEGEVLVRGSLVMRGYYLAPELTAQAIDSEKWLHTGDKGEIDQDGFLIIHGRLKELYKTSTGEYVAPVPIEQEICKVPLIESAMVVAEGRKFASCLLFPNKDVMDHLKASMKLNHQSDEEFLQSEYVKKQMDNLFENINQHLNYWEQIRAYRFVPHPPSIEGGELTPTLKIRRDVVAKKYDQLIDSMYLEGAKV